LGAKCGHKQGIRCARDEDIIVRLDELEGLLVCSERELRECFERGCEVREPLVVVFVLIF